MIDEPISHLRSASGPDVERVALTNFLRRLAFFLLLLLVSWIGLYLAWNAVPHIRAGHLQIYEKKLADISGADIFPEEAPPIRIAVFGNSRVLAGFRPELVDELSKGRAYAYNFGLPATSRILDPLETLLDRGQEPTHVLLTLPWPRRDTSLYEELLQNDNRLINKIFPFRHFLRDLAQFMGRAPAQGGPLAYYRHMAELVAQSRRDRGYFFIEAQSHFPGHRLPDDFSDGSEQPDVEWTREFPTSGAGFDRLRALAKRGGFEILVVRLHYRESLYAPPKDRPETRATLAQHGIKLLGPTYWLYPNKFFSDPTHMNPSGADANTRRLWKLIEPDLLQGRIQEEAPPLTRARNAEDEP